MQSHLRQLQFGQAEKYYKNEFATIQCIMYSGVSTKFLTKIHKHQFENAQGFICSQHNFLGISGFAGSMILINNAQLLQYTNKIKIMNLLLVNVYIYHLMLMQRFVSKVILVLVYKGQAMGQLQHQLQTATVLNMVTIIYIFHCTLQNKEKI